MPLWRSQDQRYSLSSSGILVRIIGSSACNTPQLSAKHSSQQLTEATHRAVITNLSLL
ncbi:hypothetical protein LEMLEM_LOCUS19713 [Lemmus lemmus]